MDLLLAAAAMGLAVAFLLLLASRLNFFSKPSGGKAKGGAKPEGSQGLPPRSCPLCGALLSPGERVHSDLSPGKGDRIMRIYGCPHCWPSLPGKGDRVCPVCGGVIAPEGYAVARYFERPGRKHVHVLGCTGCRRV